MDWLQNIPFTLALSFGSALVSLVLMKLIQKWVGVDHSHDQEEEQDFDHQEGEMEAEKSSG